MHTSIHTTGRLRSCCIALEEVEDEGRRLDVINDGFDTIINSSSMRDLRGQMRLGKRPANCKTCWIDEANGKVSKRMYEMKHVEMMHDPVDYTVEPKVFRDIQLGVGNICNLKCRTCSPYCSTKWIQEYKDRVGAETTTYNNLTNNKQTLGSKFWDELDEWSSTVRRLEIMGGEPFYMKEFETLIDRLIENGNSKNIMISMSSNGTIYKDEFVNKILENFWGFGIQLSIDGVGEHFDYLRHGNNWDNVKRNIDSFYKIFQEHHSFALGVTITVSQLNMYYIREIHEFFEQNYPNVGQKVFQTFNNVVHYPSYYSSNCMPEEIKEVYLDKICNPTAHGLSAWDEEKFNEQILPLVNHVKSKSKPDDWKSFIKETEEADAYRNENVKETFPELFKLFEPHWDVQDKPFWKLNVK